MNSSPCSSHVMSSSGPRDEHHQAGSKALEVAPSQLGTEAGLGLFVQQAVAPGEVLCEYRGRTFTTAEAMRLEDKSYLMRYIDAREDTSLIARYINDCRNPAVYNVSFEKRPGEGRALVVACRPISAGEELFVDYGRWYWAKLRPTKIGVRQAAEILKDAEREAERQQRAMIPSAEGDFVEKLLQRNYGVCMKSTPINNNALSTDSRLTVYRLARRVLSNGYSG
eukprot:s2086_g18.t1